MNENNVERIAKILAEDQGDPQAWGAYASKAMQIIEIAQDDWKGFWPDGKYTLADEPPSPLPTQEG